MITEQKEERIEYVKPAIDDLGALAVVFGGTPCSSGGSATGEWCRNGTGAAAYSCSSGNLVTT